MSETSPSQSPLLRLVRLSELAQAIGVGPHTIRRWVKDGTFPAPLYIKQGGSARWRLKDVDAWLEKQKRSRRRPPPITGRLKNLKGLKQ